MKASCENFIFLTGSPGIGKTTLIKKVCEVLKKKHFKLRGFFTEEIRSNGERIGFDVVSLDGKRAPLARIGDSTRGPKVGKYTVNVTSFEIVSLPQFTGSENDILILDEIGKMELFSTSFKNEVNKCVTNFKGIILGTVPLKSGASLPLVDKIKNHPNTLLIHVDRANRETLTEKIVQHILEATLP